MRAEEFEEARTAFEAQMRTFKAMLPDGGSLIDHEEALRMAFERDWREAQRECSAHMSKKLSGLCGFQTVDFYLEPLNDCNYVSYITNKKIAIEAVSSRDICEVSKKIFRIGDDYFKVLKYDIRVMSEAEVAKLLMNQTAKVSK